MNQTTFENQIRTCIAKRMAELREEIQDETIAGIIKAMADRALPPRPKATVAAPLPRSNGGVTGTIRALLAESPWLSTREIIDRMPGESSGSVRSIIGVMKSEGELQVRGERMQYRYALARVVAPQTNGHTKPRAPHSESLSAKIRSAIRANPKCDAATVSEKTGATAAQVATRLHYMVQSGAVKRQRINGLWRYEIGRAG